MSPRRKTRDRGTGTLIVLIAIAVIGTGCTTTLEPATPAQPAEITTDPVRQWEQDTRILTDDLMSDARRLVELGDEDAALNRIDEALCAVLDPPEELADDPVYLNYVAALLTAAESLESQIGDDQIDGQSREVVALPPIDVAVDTSDAAETVDPGGLPASEFPLVLNSTVDDFLRAMTSEGEYRRRITTGLERAGAYLPMIRAKFEAAGLPVEISYLPLIESAFSVKAYSRARAHGMWQFMSATGRYYGLEVGSLVDERRDPVRATEAAVAYLADLFNEFDDWHLALAAYNSGAGNVRRAIRRSGSRDFWVLKRYLPRETRNYVPAFIASVIVAKNPEHWGFPVPDEQPWSYDRVDVPDALDLQFLADRTSLDIDDLRRLNPAIRRDLTPAKRVTALWLPPGDAGEVGAVLAATPRSEWAPRMIHTVRRGENLSVIAARYGSSVSAIKQANGLRRTMIHPGQNLIVPRFGAPVARPEHRVAEHGTYVVQSNDTLWDIARSFSVSLDALCAANGLGARSVIQPGQRLRLPSGAHTTSTAVRSSSSSWSDSYTVRRGDTLSAIAARYGTSVREVRRVNGLSSSRIYPGNKLVVPGSGGDGDEGGQATTYRVRRGDTLYDIARQFGVSVSELRRFNGLSSSRIYPGDVLRIPARQAKG